MTNDNSDDASRGRLLGRITALLWVVVIALVVTFFYFASSLCITVLLAGFLAILVDPVLGLLEKLHFPRSAAAALVVVFGMIVVSATLYAFYNKTTDFIDTLPQYRSKIRKTVAPITDKIQRVQENAGRLSPASPSKKVPEVRISETPSWPAYLARGVGSVSGTIVIAGVVPFLVFFMLVRKDHIFWWLSTTFANVTDVSNFVTRLTRMVRGFAGGSLVVGSILAAVTVAVLAGIGMQGAFALGIASGFLNLIPFLGVVLGRHRSPVCSHPAIRNRWPFRDHCVDGGLLAFGFREFVGTQIHRFACKYRASRSHCGDVILELGMGRGRIAAGRTIHGVRKTRCRLPSGSAANLKLACGDAAPSATLGADRPYDGCARDSVFA